jgi:hypothetical protein
MGFAGGKGAITVNQFSWMGFTGEEKHDYPEQISLEGNMRL